MPQPSDPVLYERVKSQAKSKFKAWPSAYASSWLTKEYKRRGGTYKGRKSGKVGTTRWHKEKWVNVCEKGWPACGRNSAGQGAYPTCRPTVRITQKTPKLAQHFTKTELARFCSKKRRNPQQRLKMSKRRTTQKRKSRRR